MPLPSLLPRGKDKPAQTNLIEAALSLLDLLEEVDRYPALYLNRHILQNALFRYEHRWIPLLACIPPSERPFVMPPLDVHWVWLCHMLNPVAYQRDSAAMWLTLRPDEPAFVIDHHLPAAADRQEARRRAALMWSELFPDQSFDILQSLRGAPIRDEGYHLHGESTMHRKPGSHQDSSIIYDIAAAAERQMQFHYQVSMPQYRDKKYLKRSVHRYKDMFLKMFKRTPGETWVPTYDIDLIWHAHMMHPRWYKEHTMKLCKSVIPHDDTLHERAPGSFLISKWALTQQQWKKMFLFERVVRDGGMWRGDVDAEERIERLLVQTAVRNIEKRVVRSVEQSAKGWLEEKESKLITFSVVCGHAINTRELNPSRVHTIDWQTANRPKKALDNGKATKIEGVRYLKYGDRPNFLFCRTLHFLKYDKMSQPDSFGSVLEIYGVGISPDIPLATANFVYPNSMCKTTEIECRQREDELALLLRVANEDYGILCGRWSNFQPPKKGTDLNSGTRGLRGGLKLRLWMLGNSSGYWLNLKRQRHSQEPGKYSFDVPVMNDGNNATSSVNFDLKEGTVSIEDASHMVPAFLLGMAAATLHVILQPRLSPKSWEGGTLTSTMFPEWSAQQQPYEMIRGAGGEIRGPSGYQGLWSMLMLSLPSLTDSKQAMPPREFVGAIHKIRAPESVMPGV